MKNIIVVTGGAGFVGANLIELFIKKTKYKIISIDAAKISDGGEGAIIIKLKKMF